MNKIENLLAALNKCEAIKSYENVTYTLIDDELRSYIQKELEQFKQFKSAVKKELSILEDRRFDAYVCDDYETYRILNETIEELKEVLGSE